MSQSLYPTTDSARAQRAAEWIYSISLADKNTEPIENGNPSPTVSASEVPPTAPVPEVISPTMANKEVQADPAGIDQSQRSNAIPRVQSPCPPKPNYPADQQPRILPTADSKPPIPTLDFQSRPQSKLPSILRRKSTSDRSASVTTVFRRTYRALSPKKSEEPRRYSLIAVEPKAKVPSRLPLPTLFCNRQNFNYIGNITDLLGGYSLNGFCRKNGRARRSVVPFLFSRYLSVSAAGASKLTGLKSLFGAICVPALERLCRQHGERSC
uniref:Uncharacterized protein n=1 Tax=Panagrolaimus sp. JU765 TaxID=591449 RepID=A0AC34R4Q2_9BILA